MRHGSLSVKASINLYEALVRSVLEYGAEIWTNQEWEDGESTEGDGKTNSPMPRKDY